MALEAGLVIKPRSGLAEGNYKITAAKAIKANTGETVTAYEIYFKVGEKPSGGNDGEVSGDVYEIVFDIEGITGDTKYIVTVRQDSQIFYPDSGSTFFLEQGEYTYAVSAAGYVTVNGSFTVSEAATIPVTMVDHVFVTFNTVPPGASVRVKAGQDEFIDAYQENVFRLTPGIEYTYVVEAKGYTTKAQRFTPVADETKTIELVLSGAADGYCEQGNGGNTLI